MKDMIEQQVSELKRLWRNKRQLGHQILNLGMIVFSALMMWKGLMCLTLCEAPVVVVLRYGTRTHRFSGINLSSGSMEPAFQRGDILFLNNNVCVKGNSHEIQVLKTLRSIRSILVILLSLKSKTETFRSSIEF